MRNIKLTIEYEGTNYAGWQSQRLSSKTVQETIEKKLRKILQEKVKLISSGRTDSGVHAKAQVANFKTNSDLNLLKLQRALNGLLPDDIVISKISQVRLDFHSRYNAKSKLYRYTILNRRYPSARLKNFVYFYQYPLDVKTMQRQARLLLGRQDFKSFRAQDKKAGSSVRTIKALNVRKRGDFIHIDIEADGFLYNMVRNIAGTLIEIGRGKFKNGCLKKILSARNRSLAGPTLPARGLCLEKVKY